MDHESAVREQATERYLLNEMAAAERTAFEEHFFDCGTCARDVREGMAFLANARSVFAEEAHAPAREIRGWRAFLRLPTLVPSFAAAALAAVVVYQSTVVMPRLRDAAAPQAIASVMLHATARGAEQAVRIPAGAAFFQIGIDVNAAGSFTAYECVVVGEDERPVAQLSAPGGGASLHLLLPAARFTDGRYTLILRGVAGDRRTELDRFQFVVQKEE